MTALTIIERIVLGNVVVWLVRRVTTIDMDTISGVVMDEAVINDIARRRDVQAMVELSIVAIIVDIEIDELVVVGAKFGGENALVRRVLYLTVHETYMVCTNRDFDRIVGRVRGIEYEA